MWQEHAACRGLDTGLFFSGENPRENAAAEAKKRERAREICAGCPVRVQCLEYAVLWDCVGIWGGMTTKERAKYAKELKRDAG